MQVPGGRPAPTPCLPPSSAMPVWRTRCRMGRRTLWGTARRSCGQRESGGGITGWQQRGSCSLVVALHGSAAPRRPAVGPPSIGQGTGGCTHSPGQMGSPGAACATASSAIRSAAARGRASMVAENDGRNQLQCSSTRGGGMRERPVGAAAGAAGGAPHGLSRRGSELYGSAHCPLAAQRPGGGGATHPKAVRSCVASAGRPGAVAP